MGMRQKRLIDPNGQKLLFLGIKWSFAISTGIVSLVSGKVRGKRHETIKAHNYIRMYIVHREVRGPIIVYLCFLVSLSSLLAAPL